MGHLIRVLVVEREPLFRRGLIGSLNASEGIAVVASASARDVALRLLNEHASEVAIIGSCDGDDPPVEVAAEVHRLYPGVATIVIAPRKSDDDLVAAIRAGVSAYCDRDIDEETLDALIRRAADGEYVINEQLLAKPHVAARVLDQFRTTSQPDPHLAGTFMPLTDRELEILKRVCAGLTNAEIGYSLGITAQTVKNHVTSILRKLAVSDRTQAVVTALRHGWLSIDDEELTAGPTHGPGDDAHAPANHALPPHRDH